MSAQLPALQNQELTRAHAAHACSLFPQQDKFGKSYDECTAHERIQVGGTKGGIVTKVRGCAWLTGRAACRCAVAGPLVQGGDVLTPCTLMVAVCRADLGSMQVGVRLLRPSAALPAAEADACTCVCSTMPAGGAAMTCFAASTAQRMHLCASP